MMTYVKLTAKEHPDYVIKKGNLCRLYEHGADPYLTAMEGSSSFIGTPLGELNHRGELNFTVLVPQEHYDAYMDEWVEQDRVPVREGADSVRWSDWVSGRWETANGYWTSGTRHGSVMCNAVLSVRCKRRDLPPIPTPQPAPPKPEYPKVYGTLAGADIPFILVRTSATECYELSDLTGWLPGKPMPWNENRDRQLRSGKLIDITNDCNLDEHCESRRTSILYSDFARLRRVAKHAGQSIDKMRAVIIDQQRQIDDLHSITHSKECDTLAELNQNPQWKPIPGWRYVSTKPLGDGVYVHSYVSMDQRQCHATSLN